MVMETDILCVRVDAVKTERDPGEDAGGESASELAVLFRSEYPGLVRLAHLLTGSNAVGEEIVQDAFEQIQRRWQSVRKPEAYLRQTVVNRCKGHHRRRAVERKHTPPPPRHELLTEVDEMWPLIQQLSPKRRAVLVLRFYEDLTISDIAAVLDMRPGTVKSVLHRTLESLKEKLG